MSTKIYKIGGAFLKTAEDIKKLPAIIEKANIKDNKGNKLLLIVSAFQKITSQLSFAGTVAEHDGAEAGLMLVDEIINFHLKIVEELFVSTPDYDVVKRYVLDQKLRLENLIRGINLTNELSPQSKDTLLSIGEMLASRIVTGFLKKYYNHILLFNSADVFITDNSYGAAVPDIQETEIAIKDALIPLFKHVNLIVAQGFIGSTKSSDVTTMGMESSNLTATIYAGVLGADELVF
jgi:aspartate kinase